MRFLSGLAVMAFGVSIPAGAAMAQNIDCANAQSTIEMNFCADREYAAADAALNDIYKQALAEIAKSDGEKPYDPKSWETALRASQRAWIAFRDADCKGLEPMQWSGGTGSTGAVLGCMTQLTQERIRVLKERFAEAEGPPRVP
jgi:uncharacterized protein YecT (DUF1311 family)